MKILITAPSLDENENVSGIASLVKAISAAGSAEYIHFTAGRKDSDKFGISWIAGQLRLPSAFRKALRRSEARIAHINTSFEPRALIRDLVLARVAKKAGVPVLVHVHGGRFVLQDFPNQYLRLIAERLVAAADLVIVQSLAEEVKLLKNFPGLKSKVLPNAIAVDEAGPVTRVAGEKTIIYFGRLHASKGLDDIVAACGVLKDQGFKFNFACYGTGPEKDNFVTEMSLLLNGRFEYRGVARGGEKWKAFGSADLFLLPSRFEGLPLALLEAMASGCVPVVSRVGMIGEVVDDGRNGFIIEPGNVTQIVGKLKMLLSESEKQWDEYRVKARETIVSKFNIKDYTAKLERIYAELAGTK